MMKKKYLLFGMLLTGMLTLAACGGQQNTAQASAVYDSDDGWSITYNPNEMRLNEQDDSVDFVYLGESSGTDMVSISYVADKMPQEVLYEKTQDIDPSLVTRDEGIFGSTEAWAFTYSVSATEGSGLSEQFSGIEHNGGTLLIDILTHGEVDEARGEAVSDAIATLVDTLVFTNHQPQEQFAYVLGTYYQDYTDEIEGQTVNVRYSIELNEDHTGIMHIQDDINIIWTSNQLVAEGFSYEYTIEGDSLLVNFGEGTVWESFEKSAATKDLLDTDFTKYAGTYTSENQDTLTIDEKGNVEIGIVRLTQMEGTASGVSKGVMPITVTDASGNPMGLEFVFDSKELIVTESTWELLPNGETFIFNQ